MDDLGKDIYPSQPQCSFVEMRYLYVPFSILVRELNEGNKGRAPTWFPSIPFPFGNLNCHTLEDIIYLYPLSLDLINCPTKHYIFSVKVSGRQETRIRVGGSWHQDYSQGQLC